MSKKASYIWDIARRLFINPDGDVLSPADVRSVIADLADTAAARMKGMGELLRVGKLTREGFQLVMAKEVVSLQRTAFVVANGGYEQMTDELWSRLAQTLQFQLMKLQQFTHSIPVKVSERDGTIRTRAALYGYSATQTYENAVRKREVDAGMSIERRRLGRSKESCDDCLAIEELGWQDIGSLPNIGEKLGGGQSACRVMCDCYFEFEMAIPA